MDRLLVVDAARRAEKFISKAIAVGPWSPWSTACSRSMRPSAATSVWYRGRRKAKWWCEWPD